MVMLRDHLVATGADIDGWEWLSPAAVSDDGLTIIGSGRYHGVERAFRVRLAELPPPTHCPADWDYSGTLNSTDFFTFLTPFFAAEADFDESGATASQDFSSFVAAFFSGC